MAATMKGGERDLSLFSQQRVLEIAEELSLLRLKYEQLIQISKTLLEPWPDQQTAFDTSLEPRPPSPPPPAPVPPEIEQIDKILATAQRLRVHKTTPTKNVQKTTPSYSKSVQKAKSVYTGSASCKPTTNSKTISGKKKPINSMTSSPLDSGPLATTSVTMDTTTNKHIQPHPPIHSTDSTTSNECSFTLQQDGKTLAMPTKCRRIQNIITKFNEQFTIIDKSPVQDNVFLECIKATSNHKEGADENIRLYLEKKELLLLQESLSTLTPQELTATELQDVVRSKVKVESLFKSVERRLSNNQANPPPPPVPPSPSSVPSFLLKQWPPNYRLEYIKLSMERDFLILCRSHLIPLLQSIDPSDQKFTTLVQLIQNISGLKKTVFVSLER